MRIFETKSKHSIPAKQYLQDENIILPFFTLQEITAVVQAELTAERKSRVPSDPQRQATLMQFLGYGNWLSVRPDGPFGFVVTISGAKTRAPRRSTRFCKLLTPAHIAVGHTVQKGGRIRPRFNNKVFLIDTGMLSSYYPGGRASALEICDDTKFTAEYMDQESILVGPGASSLRELKPSSRGSA